jgi:hypothetical protein
MVRQGTFLLICMALVATLTVLAFAFLRSVQSAHASGDATNRDMLSREAALQGFQHATEDLLRGYISDPQNPGFPAFTRLENQSFAPFTCINGPNYSNANTMASMIDRDDVGADHRIPDPLTLMWWCGWDFGGRQGMMIENDFRGRYYEPSFYNFASTSAAPTIPTYPATFTAPTIPTPDRADGLFLDTHFVRIPASTPIMQARQQARYRLRYAVDIVDLDGTYPVNSDPALDYTKIVDNDPNNIADPVAKHVVQSMECIPSLYDFMTMSGGFYDAGTSAGLRMQNEFQGRGWASNVDFNPTNHTPQTFPLMYRTAGMPWYYLQGMTWQGTMWHNPPNPGNDVAELPYGATTGNQNAAGGPVGTEAGGEAWPSSGTTMNHVFLGPSYSFYQARLSCGGEHLDWGTYANCDGGGGTWEGVSQTPFSRSVIPAATPSRYGSQLDAPMTVNLMTASPAVITGMIAAYMPDGVYFAQYYPSAAEAASATASATAGAIATIWETKQGSTYPQDIEVRFEGTGSGASATASLNATGSITAINITNGGAGYGLSNSIYFIEEKPSNATWDLFLPALSPAFGPGYGNYVQPQNSMKGINPDFHIWHRHPGDPGYRGPGNRYPGPLCFNGWDLNNNPHHDDLGRFIDVSDQYACRDPITYTGPYTVGTCPYIAPHLVTEKYTDTNGNGKWDAGEPISDVSGATAPYNTNGVLDLANQGPPHQFGTAPVLMDEYWQATLAPDRDSFYADMIAAMSNAIAEARTMWEFYPTSTNPNPAKVFCDSVTPWPGGPWTVAGNTHRVENLHDIDALFLANLGIDINNPSSPVSFTGFVQFSSGISPHKGGMAGEPITQYSPVNLAALRTNPNFFETIQGSNLPSLNGTTASGAQLTQTMEMMLNDFRLSFLGSSPGYQQTFQALDFNGDGQVTCSAFPTSGDATEQALHIDQHVPGTAITIFGNPQYKPFCISGNFFIGKSKFYRVITRGSVWDNLRKISISESLLDSVLCVDPADEAQELAPMTSQHPARQYSTHVIYQKWWFDKYHGQMSRSY